MRQTQRKGYQRKIELMPKTRERPKQKKEEQLLINQ